MQPPTEAAGAPTAHLRSDERWALSRHFKLESRTEQDVLTLAEVLATPPAFATRELTGHGGLRGYRLRGSQRSLLVRHGTRDIGVLDEIFAKRYSALMQTSAVDAAATALRDLLARGRYQPGDRLPAERELAEGLGLSRPTLREAIRRLIEAGLLEPRRGSGTYVAAVELQGVFAVRLQLEPYAAGLAATRRDAAATQRLAALLHELRRTVDEPEAFAAVDLEIHRLIATATGNPVLAGILERLTDVMLLSRAITSPERDARQATVRDLRALGRAVRARDAAAATTAMRRHLESVREIAARRRPADRRIESLSSPRSSAAYPAAAGTDKARR